MRICMVSSHACIRVVKESLALVERGHNVEMVARQAPFGFNMFDSLSIYHGEDMLKKTIRGLHADIFHVHNEPDWMVKAVREATDKPIVFDIHDINSLRYESEPDEHEKAAFECADAFIHVSESCKAWADKVHGEREHSIILYSYVNERFVRRDEGGASFASVVYEGGLAEEENLEGDQFNMRFYAPIVKAFIDQGFNFYLFPANITQKGLYENLGAYVAAPTHYPVMLTGLRAFGFGLLGARAPARLMESAMPNKLFEYLSQGVVPVICNAAEASKFVAEHDIGITLTSLENLQEQLMRGPEIRENVMKKRYDFTMEKQIDKLIDLYEELL